MSHYPIFVDLTQRKVLLVGAGHVAERKALSLLKSGALVCVIAEKLNTTFETWLTQKKIQWLGNVFHDFYLDDVFLVIAATDKQELNQAVYQAAQAKGKLCNTVDTAKLCSFIIPAIIDRAPIQIAVSSGGTAPVLSRKWRQLIEILLPLHIGEMATIAGKWRGKVKEKIHNIEQRRHFWETLFDSQFNTLMAQGNENEAEQELNAQLQGYQPSLGEVTLVGAGPGDAGLLTLHALQAIQAADVILYDALVSDEIMAMVRKDAEKISVGKRAGLHHVQQEETNQLLVKYAQKGLRIARLKGGDPFVFGRGGEEAQALQQAKIPYRIIPGVTAALGATAYAGIPLTHRTCSQSALFITGHCHPNGQDPDWHTMALSHQTLVIYMGTLKATEITKKLIEYGRDKDTPVAVISNGTLANQIVKTGHLKNLPQLAENASRPALMVIGEVVALHNDLAWFNHQ